MGKPSLGMTFLAGMQAYSRGLGFARLHHQNFAFACVIVVKIITPDSMDNKLDQFCLANFLLTLLVHFLVVPPIYFHQHFCFLAT